MKTKSTNRTRSYVMIVGVLWALVASSPSSGDEPPDSTQTNLSNGIEVKRGEMLLSVLALRDDVVRVRMAKNGALPEDASWAVAPEVRNSKVDVVPESSG